MRSDAIIIVFVLLLTSALLFAFTTCGGGGNDRVAQPFRAGNSEQSTRAEALDYRTGESLDEALAELEELECPEGVDGELWRELKRALEEALEEHSSGRRGSLAPQGEEPGWLARPTHAGGKFVSAPPTGDNNRVRDLTLDDHYDGAYTLTWGYQNSGDYDQNGTVGISDITPIAIHYGEEVPEGDSDRNTIQAVVDGSENDKVDIADITPIAMYYGICCAAYSIRSALSYPETVEETVEIDTAPIALAEGDDRKVFSVELGLYPRTYIAVTPVDEDETPGELSNLVLVPNHPPVAALTAEPSEGDAPLHVVFNAGDSHDVDGPIARYEWDWEGDGVYDLDTGDVYTAEHTYDVADYYDPQVRVTDEHNGTGTASIEVWAGRWRITVVKDDISGGPPLLTCLEVVNEHPAISFHGEIEAPEPEGIVYVRANDAMGASWGTPVLVDDTGQIQNLCGDSSLVVANGHPAIAYNNEEEGEFWYARANDADGTSWGTPHAVCAGGSCEGNVLSMAIVNGHPAIAYMSHYMRYVRADDVNGDSWESPPIDTPAFRDSPSLLVVNGNPAICCSSSIGLQYARALDADGTSWGDPIIVDSDPRTGQWWSSMAIVNGNPAICYKEDENDDLKYVRATNANGSSWGTPLTVASEGDVGDYCSLAVIHGYPAISYHDQTNDSVKYVKATDADGSNWRTPVTVDVGCGGHSFPSLHVVNGHPAISYLRQTELRFAIYY